MKNVSVKSSICKRKVSANKHKNLKNKRASSMNVSLSPRMTCAFTASKRDKLRSFEKSIFSVDYKGVTRDGSY